MAATRIGKTWKVRAPMRLQLEEQLGRDRNRQQQGGVLQHRDGLIACRRHDHPHRLRQHDPPHRLAAAHAECLRGLHLTRVHTEDAGARDLGHVRGLGGG